MRRRGVVVAVLGAVAGGLAVAGCGDAGAGDRELLVLAAASLTDVLPPVVAAFEAAEPGVELTTSFGGSAGLVQQVLAGAPADVLVTASAATAAQVVDAGLAAGAPVVVAVNELVLAVPAGNPGEVSGVDDLARDDLVVALCAAQVPCGAAAEQVLTAAGVRAAPDTLEQDVRGVLTRLELGEVDAGLVYRTDALAAGDAVEVVPVPGAAAAANEYQALALTSAADAGLAAAFVDHLRAPAARDALAEAGFVVP
ncbi:molybdate ABC transporter substrate-binding protein [Aquipuribacter nitratireducens]|uniref:Molybdate ABC transporter substrate-binding protein n=1 Tax=Aquipuribacter nitratireducens TaxID=650104 RepID=A0ABW0GME0_9MICO